VGLTEEFFLLKNCYKYASLPQCNLKNPPLTDISAFMDIQFTQFINSLAGMVPLLDSLMIAVTQFGVPLIIVIVAAQWWSSIERQHVRHVAVAAGLAFLLSLAFNQIILLFIHRIRPYDAGISHVIIDKSADWSFPSDHATAAFAVVFAFMRQRLNSRFLMLFALATLVCVSRVYVGTHYVSDILGGIIVALFAVIVVRLIYKEGSKLDRIITGIL
jgi:undecaprenyl-diphosphatase